MYKVRRIKFVNHPVLNNMEFDFTGTDGKAVDTVIFAGENGCGKSILINELYRAVSGQSPASNITEYEIDGKVYIIKTIRKMQTRGQFNNLTLKEIITVSNYLHLPRFFQM